jgi:hypothetical protein
MVRQGRAAAGGTSRNRRLPRPTQPTRPTRATEPSGFALLVAIFVVFLLSMTLSLVGLSLALRMRIAQQETRAMTLTALCDAAVAEALAALAGGAADGIAEHAFGNGTIGSQVERLSPTRFRITATARFGGKARTVLADVVRDLEGTRVVHWRRLSG